MTEPAEPQGTDADLGEVTLAIRAFTTACRNRWKAALMAFLVVFSAVWIYGFFGPAKYSAYAAVMVQKVRYSPRIASDPASVPSVVTEGVSDEEVNSERAILTSHEVLSKTVDNTGLAETEDPWYLKILFAPLRAYESLHASWHGVPPRTKKSRAVGGLLDSVSVEQLKDSNVLVISYAIGHPTVAELVLKELLKNYLDHHLLVRERAQSGTFFVEQAEVVHQSVSDEEKRLDALQKGVGVPDLEAERNLQLQLHAELRTERERLARKYEELTARIDTYRDAIKEAPNKGSDAPAAADPNQLALQSLRMQVLNLEIDQVRLASRYPADSPLLAENTLMLDLAKDALDQEVAAPPGSGSGSMVAGFQQQLTRDQAELRGVVGRLGVTNRQLEASYKELAKLNGHRREARDIERRLRTAEEKYLTYLRRGEEMRMDVALDQQGLTNVTVVQQPTASPKPTSPRKLRLLIASIVGGLLASLLVVVVTELETLGLDQLVASMAPGETA